MTIEQADVRESAPGIHVAGLDAIRFVCALWVVFGHGHSFPLTAGVDRSHPLGWFVNVFWASSFSGPAAVIVFFVISGFVIHFPYCRGKEFLLGEYLVRRYVRIGLPLVAAIAVASLTGVKLPIFGATILWSLYAELIYYTLYPALRIFRRVLSWEAMIGLSFFGSFLVVMTNPLAGNYPSYGVGLNWALGFPCWLLGVKLNEWITEPRRVKIALRPARVGIWVLSVLALMLRFQTPIGYPWSLNLFAMAVFIWLAAEIAGAPPVLSPFGRFLEQSGAFSYSLYLTHPMASRIWKSWDAVPNLGYFMNWLSLMGFIILFAWLFYRLVEKPGHSMARHLAGRMRGKNI